MMDTTTYSQEDVGFSFILEVHSNNNDMNPLHRGCLCSEWKNHISLDDIGKGY